MSIPEKNNPKSTTASGVHWFGLLIVLVATTLQAWAVLSTQPLQSANDRSRWCTVWSLVEHGTYHIDEIDQVPHWSTIDKVRHRNNDAEPWHFYSSKPPLFPTMVAGLYWLERHTLGFDLLKDTALVTRLLLLLVNVLPMFLAMLAFRKSLAVLDTSSRATSLLLLTAGFASMLNPFLTTLNNHTPAATAVLFCLAAMIRLRASKQPANSDFAIVGVSAALSCCFELPAALFGLISFFYVVQIDWRKTAKFYVPAALIPLAAFFVTNVICTGGIKPFYTYYGTEKYVYIHEGVPSYWASPQGIDANTESPAVYLFHCVLGHHGILALTPIFLLTLAGWWIGCRHSKFSAACGVFRIGIGLSVCVLTFYLTRTQNYNYGGNSAALRWMLWLTPFWWYGMIPAVERLAASAKGTLVVALLLVPSVLAPMYSMTQPWRPGWLYVEMERRGWIDYHTKIPPFEPSRYSVIRKQPTSAGVVVHWTGGADAVGSEVVISTLSSITTNGLKLFPWRLRRMTPAGVTEAIIVVDPATFESGRDIASGLRSIPKEIDLSRTTEIAVRQLQPAPDWVVQLLRGLPAPRPYNAASPRYLKYTRHTGEKTAVRCDRAAARVPVTSAELEKCWHRCDVYYCDDLPFGVAQWTISITSDESNQLLRRETWTCRDLP